MPAAKSRSISKTSRPVRLTLRSSSRRRLMVTSRSAPPRLIARSIFLMAPKTVFLMSPLLRVSARTQFLRTRGLTEPTRAVPLKLAIPPLQAASIEDDDDLQDMWSGLLVNAADADSGIDVKRAFIDILERISPLEAHILKTIYGLDFEQTRATGAETARLPKTATVCRSEGDNSPEPPMEIALALGNLTPLGAAPSFHVGGEIFYIVNTTLPGKALIEAVASSAGRTT